MIFVLMCLLFVLYVLSLPLRLHYQTKYAGNASGLAWSGTKTFAVLVLFTLCILGLFEIIERI
jgi:hypothetical protein